VSGFKSYLLFQILLCFSSVNRDLTNLILSVLIVSFVIHNNPRLWLSCDRTSTFRLTYE